MSPEAAHPARSMTLRQLVDRYCALSPEFGRAIPLSAFQLSRDETGRTFSGFDEDYHISRFLEFSELDGEKYSINGISATHVTMDADIETLL
jgi:hypothetical protein